VTLLLYVLALFAPEPAAAPACAPPPKITVTVDCEPDEGCDEKWVFVEREAPLS
jgi:hypothetical protein